MDTPHESNTRHDAPPLLRGLGLAEATALNVANMVGIGPFITIPIFLSKMGGPQALVAWIAAALLVLCDGLVWSELGAALPGSGGTYHFLREIFGRYRGGRLLSFLFIWQFLVTGTLELASGYIGSMPYVVYIFRDTALFQRANRALEAGQTPLELGAMAAAASLLVTLLLCRRIRVLGWFGIVLSAGTLLTVACVIAAGTTHFDASLLEFPAGAFTLNLGFAIGLGGAMRIAIYDYLGYYNICHLGDEVRDPGRTIPRAVMTSVIVVAALYLTMNIAIIGVIPWREAMESRNIAADLMERLYGRPVAVAFTWMILWTAAACVFAMTLGYSRIPYAAARAGDFFAVFARVHPRERYPTVALMAIGLLTAIFCCFPLQQVIDAAVTVRIGVQFIGQIVALHLLRVSRPDVAMPFRMWLYPIPSLLALAGWLFVLGSDRPGLILALGVNGAGCLAFLVWRCVTRVRGQAS